MIADWRAIHIDEPRLSFGHDQCAEHPKDGLFLFGPVASGHNPARMDVGVIATPAGLEKYSKWIASIEKFIDVPPPAPNRKRNDANTFVWPGFEAVYGAAWPSRPFATCMIDAAELSRRILDADRHQAIYSAVALYEEALRKYLREEEARPQLWFAVVPEDVYKYGRPLSTVPVKLRTPGTRKLGMKAARAILTQGSMFLEEMQAAAVYEYELNFHNQLKARLMDTGQVIQVVKEATLDPPTEKAKARMQDPATIAWNLSTTSYYKIGARPWRLADLRDGVCYVGLVFKRIDRPSGRDNACCGAQMFLGSGDGLVFRGAVGPWYSETKDAFHLDQDQAAKLMEMIVRAYKDNHGAPPSELFIHGKTNFDAEEWAGFASAVPHTTRLVGVQIRDNADIKVFRYGANAVLRGTAVVTSATSGYLWTRGYIPRLRTYPGREVPNPLSVQIRRGAADIEQVMRDVMSLTKLNFNAAEFCDGLPVTLRFADLVGEILTAGPITPHAPLPFKFYI
ncbi:MULTISPECIES: hypothetical protein [unclassified Bradyrhizobium]|uniref:argonaute/piwi family protein n=1 Tax=unclassified Bradyrhizobium TaxID=2631580 RepID=UPI0028F1035F|nr:MULTISPECIES: hypothetical protein [unclassified Bradyrhizobium]